MAIEDHADIPDQQPAFHADLDPVVVDGEQTHLLQFLQLLELGGEVGAESDRIGFLQRPYRELEVAHQHLDDEATQHVIHRQLIAAHDRQLAVVEAVVVFLQRLSVLAVAHADGADGRDAAGDQVGFGMRRIALEIAVQPALALRDRQFVLWLGEMIHADIDIAGVVQAADAQRQHVELGVGAGQVVFVDAALRLEQVRQVRVMVDGDAVGIGFDDLRQRPVDRHHRLLRQPVDEVDADGAEARLARGADRRQRLFLRLDAVDRLLHVGVEILHAEADAVEPLPAQGVDALGRDAARIDFDRVLALLVVGQPEPAADVLHQVVHLRIRQVGRGAAAEVQLLDVVEAGEELALHLDLALQVAEIDGGLVTVLRDDLVAAAVVADGVAERNVDVQRQRMAGAARMQVGDRLQVVAVAEGVVEAVRGRIRGVARPRLAQPADQAGIELHMLDRVDRYGGQGHRGRLLAMNARSRFQGDRSLRMLHCNVLARVQRQMLQDLGREPTPEELARELDMTPEKVVEVQKYGREPISLHTPLGEDGDSEFGDLIEDTEAVVPADAVGFTMLQKQLESLLDSLSEREAGVIRMRFGLGDGIPKTLDQIGDTFGVTRERIRQIESKTMAKLRHPSRSQSLRDYLE